MRKFLLIPFALAWIGFVGATVMTGSGQVTTTTEEGPTRRVTPGCPAPAAVTAPSAPSGLGPATSVSNALPPAPIPTSTGLGPEISVPPATGDTNRPPRNLIDQTPADAEAKSVGCMECHKTTDAPSMHSSPNVVLGCTDCHGGNAAAKRPPNTSVADASYQSVLKSAHVLPRFPIQWGYPSSANPPGSFAQLNRESPEFIRFINPGDLRVARQACGACHLPAWPGPSARCRR